ncbi:hypothetical protein MTO96_001609 [Rhipicephalus appendiculatus]
MCLTGDANQRAASVLAPLPSCSSARKGSGAARELLASSLSGRRPISGRNGMSSATTPKNGDRSEQAGSSGAESSERQVQPCAEESCRPAARPSLVQELAARTGCAVSASGSESGVSPSSSMGDVPPFAPAPSPAGSAPPCSSYLLQQLASSCSFPNSLDGVQSTCHSSPCGGPASSMQLRSSPSAAASFFARAAQRLNLSSKRRRRHGGGSATADGSQSAADGPVFVTRYAELPPGLASCRTAGPAQGSQPQGHRPWKGEPQSYDSHILPRILSVAAVHSLSFWTP